MSGTEGADWAGRSSWSRHRLGQTGNVLCALTAQAVARPSLSPCPASLEIINPRSCFDQRADVLEHLELNQSSKKLVFAKKLLK